MEQVIILFGGFLEVVIVGGTIGIIYLIRDNKKREAEHSG